MSEKRRLDINRKGEVRTGHRWGIAVVVFSVAVGVVGVTGAFGRTAGPGGDAECTDGLCPDPDHAPGAGTLMSMSLAEGVDAERGWIGLGWWLDTSDFPARWNCGQWTKTHGWVHIVSDWLIFAAYAAIPISLAYFVRRRRDMPFHGVFWWFVAFIFSCGVGHLIDSFIFWWPAYRLSGFMKVVTALASWGTVLVMLPVIPRALSLPGLEKVNEELEEEVQQRRRVELELERRAVDLQRAMDEVARFNRLVMGRERRVLDLKSEVNGLLSRLGEPPRYRPADRNQPEEAGSDDA